MLFVQYYEMKARGFTQKCQTLSDLLNLYHGLKIQGPIWLDGMISYRVLIPY